ncbi:MAG: threonine/serine dehydratase [Roseovarius sp.]|nr:threonine/serine dehydratase [Roseovarius sp.]
MAAVDFPNLSDIEAAADRLLGKSVKTPLLESESVNALLGGRLLIKAETLQKTGSFKFRGAYNKLYSLDASERQKGVIAYSSGNHAQGVAAAARLFDTSAKILMPADAPRIKMKRSQAAGADVITYDRQNDDRHKIMLEIVAETGECFIPPYDDPQIIAGQGTVGLELMDQASEMGLVPDAVLVCCGGGGLTAGIATAVKQMNSDTDVYTVEPAGFDDTARSFETGRQEPNAPDAQSICDALQSRLGDLTFSINKEIATSGLVVDDDEVMAAMALAFREFKLVIEPGGAVALAAALNGRIETKNKIIIAVASGGNVDPELYREILLRDQEK